MNKFSRKIISLLSSCCLLGASFSGVKAMININNRIEIGSDSDDENNIRELREAQIFEQPQPLRVYELPNFGYAWEKGRKEFKKNRARVLRAGEKNKLTMLPYDVTNIISNNRKKTAAVVGIPMATYLLYRFYSKATAKENVDWDLEDNDDDDSDY